MIEMTYLEVPMKPMYKFRTFICFQYEICEYRRLLFDATFMLNIRKLISANFREGTKGASEKLRYVRESTKFAYQIPRVFMQFSCLLLSS